MRLNSNSQLRFLVSVYLNGKKEDQAVEAYVPGNSLEGKGYVVRHVIKNGRPASMLNFKGLTLSGELPTGLYDLEYALCEKVFGDVRIELADDATMFPDKESN